jgi:hypothetical protein
MAGQNAGRMAAIAVIGLAQKGVITLVHGEVIEAAPAPVTRPAQETHGFRQAALASWLIPALTIVSFWIQLSQ